MQMLTKMPGCPYATCVCAQVFNVVQTNLTRRGFDLAMENGAFVLTRGGVLIGVVPIEDEKSQNLATRASHVFSETRQWFMRLIGRFGFGNAHATA